jgi:hypothetical protein
MRSSNFNAATLRRSHMNGAAERRFAAVCVRLVVAMLLLGMLSWRICLAGNIQPNSYAWSENAGWVNFAPTAGPGVTVSDSGVTGFAWTENLGWINFAPIASGVANDGTGKLSGYAWGENIGWIHFSPNGVPVIINASGQFSGFAWGENIGWINFSVTPGVTTSWLGSDVIFANGFESPPGKPDWSVSNTYQ